MSAAAMHIPEVLSRYLVDWPPPDSEFIYHWSGCRTRRSTGVSESPRPLSPSNLLEASDLAVAVETASHCFTMVELGAGYGRWLVAGAMFARQRGIPFRLIGVEAERAHFAMMRQHFLDNDIDPNEQTLVEGAVSDKDGTVLFTQGHSTDWWGQAIIPSRDSAFGNWPNATVDEVAAYSIDTILRDVDRIDLIDMDIQGAEETAVHAGLSCLARTRRVHIGTHSASAEEHLRSTFSSLGWRKIHDYGCATMADTPYGQIKLKDGVQSWLNPEEP